ncbi:MAG: EVE domain-containing protein [Candidatus Atribacteria bacterium]|nr:EVE domain-containing protein [Candidatus Atribacteria bacterium]
MKQKQKEMPDNQRQYWIWVTRPDYYLDPDGKEREDLNPSSGNDVSDWWTCHKNTQRGDLVFLWRTSPKKDIGYLIQAASDAYSIADNDYALKQGWDYGCDYQVLYKFANPVTMQDLHNTPYLQDWGAYKAHFFGGVFKISSEHWERLNQLASLKNPDYQKFIDSVQKEAVDRKILLEEHLEEALMRNLGLLKPFGYDLELYLDPTTGATGRQFVCKGIGGRIDLFCYDSKARRYVVIELKNVRAGQNTFGQICTYIGWVQDRIAGSIPVVGLVISRGYDAKFESSLKVTQQVFYLDIIQQLERYCRPAGAPR